MHVSLKRFLVGTLLGASALLAMEPPTPDMIEAYRRDGTLAQRLAFAKSLGNHKMGNGLAERARYKLMKAAMDKGRIAKNALPKPPDASRDMPTTGTVKTLVICIDFSDYPHNAKNEISAMTARVYGNGDAEVPPPFESLHNFYMRSSYNKLDFQGNVLGWYRPSYPRSSVQQTTAGREQLIKEALRYYEAQGHDFSQYDNNNDGKIDFMGVVWSGDNTGWSSFWWAFKTGFGDASFKVNGKSVGPYSWQYESRVRHGNNPDTCDGPFRPFTLIHEQGHGLGLPDYYDYDSNAPVGGLGGTDVMDGRGDNNCFSKWLLDWITPEIVDTTQLTAPVTKTLRDQSTNEDALLVMPKADFTGKMDQPFGEFFMVQNRQLTGNDADRYALGAGLAIFHVDSTLDANSFDFAWNNSYTEHKLVRLMEADGLEEIEQDMDANPGDFYVQGSSISNVTTPSTKKYNGSWTSFGIGNISVSGPSMTFDITTTAQDATAPTGMPTKPGIVINQDAATVTWTAGTSAEADPGGITTYHLQVGSTPAGNDIFDGTFPAATTRTLVDLGMHDGKDFYARVRAMNTAELPTAWSEGSDPVKMDLPLAPVGDALENDLLTFKAVGSWRKDPDFFAVGNASAQGTCTFNGRTTLQTSLRGPGTLNFWWKGSSEKDYDFCSFKVDGRVMDTQNDRISGENEWALRSVAIPAGPHVVSWRYEQDSNTSGRLNGLWVDDVQFKTSPEVDANTGMDILDLASFAWSYGSNTSGVDNWLPTCDLNGNLAVDDSDINMFLALAGF